MKKLIYHIIVRTLGILLAVLAVAPAMAQIVVNQCDTMEFSVTSRPSIDDTHFVWAIYNSSPNPVNVLDPAGALDPAIAFVDGQYAGRTVQVIGLEPGKYYVRIHVWDEISCTDTVEMYVMEVLETIPEVELYADSVFIGEPATVKIVFTGLGPYTIFYSYGDEITGNVVNMNGVVEGPEAVIPIQNPLPVGITEFWITQIIDQCTTYIIAPEEVQKAKVRIYPKPSNSRIFVKDE